jgi:hypothetical protein
MALCSFSDGGAMGNITFDQFAGSHQKELRSIRRLTEGGVTLIAVEFKLPNWTCTMFLDPAANYMVRKAWTQNDAEDGYHSGAEVTRFRQATPGVYFPEEVISKRRNAGRDQPDEIHTFRNVVVNQPIPASTFDLKFRHGIQVRDRIEGKKYPVNEAGIPIGPKVPLAATVVTPIDTQPRSATQQEPRSAGWWVLPTSVGLLCVAGALWYVRRRKIAIAEQ